MAQKPSDYAHALEMADKILDGLMDARSAAWIPAILVSIVVSSVTTYLWGGLLLFVVTWGTAFVGIRLLLGVGVVAVMAWRVTLKAEADKAQTENKMK
jgi:hypothetical protein